VAGRISAVRTHGKTTFIDIREEHVKLQIAVPHRGDEPAYRRGDVVGARGVAFVTKKGELSLLAQHAQDVWVVSPCLWMLPEYNKLQDLELRYRNKHLDLLTNPQSLSLIKARSSMIAALREELQKRGYLEVETPVLSPSCGGAIAVARLLLRSPLAHTTTTTRWTSSCASLPSSSSSDC
jgi:lysyl-tRNA synthetase, class II